MDEEQIKYLLNCLYSIPKDLKYVMQDEYIVRCKTVDDIIKYLEDDLADEYGQVRL